MMLKNEWCKEATINVKAQATMVNTIINAISNT